MTTKSVLLIDTDREMLTILNKLISPFHPVYVATSVDEASKILDSNPDIVLVISGHEFFLPVQSRSGRLVYTILYSDYLEIENAIDRLIKAKTVTEFINKSMPSDWFMLYLNQLIPKINNLDTAA